VRARFVHEGSAQWAASGLKAVKTTSSRSCGASGLSDQLTRVARMYAVIRPSAAFNRAVHRCSSEMASSGRVAEARDGRYSSEVQTFTATLEREDDWFVAQCREVDIVSQGRTETEALANLQEALELHLESSGEEPHVLVKVA